MKYGDLPALLALGAPHDVALLGEDVLPPLVEAAYTATGSRGRLEHVKDVNAAIRWALR